MAPVIETARLRLRGFRPSDADANAALHQDAEVLRYIGGTAMSREDSWRRMLQSVGLWDVLGYGYWCVESLTDGRYLGLVGFADFKRDLTPSIEGLPEMGWILAAHAHGQGYASEAVAAGLAWADRTLGREITAIINPENGPSLRVADKAGFKITDRTHYKEAPILILRRPAP